MRRIFHALLQWCRQRPGIALAPLLFLLYSPGLVRGARTSLLRYLTQTPWSQWLFSTELQQGLSTPADPFHAGAWLTHIDTWFGPSAFFAHLHSIFWIAAVVGALRLALRYSCDLGERNTSWVALMTLFIYATTSTAATTVLFVEQRPILVSACLSWLSVACLTASTRRSSSGLGLASTLCLATALLVSPAGLGGAAFVFAYAFYGDPRGNAARIKGCLPPLLLSGFWVLFYLNSPAHQASAACGIEGLITRVTRLLAEALAWLPPHPAQCSDPRLWVIPIGMGSLALATLAFYWVLRKASPNHKRTLCWTGLGALLSLLPALLFPADGRYLLLTSLGTSFLFASAIRRCGQAMKANPIFTAFLGLGALRHFVLAPIYTFLFSLLLPQLLAQGAQDPEDAAQEGVSQNPGGAIHENAYLAER